MNSRSKVKSVLCFALFAAITAVGAPAQNGDDEESEPVNDLNSEPPAGGGNNPPNVFLLSWEGADNQTQGKKYLWRTATDLAQGTTIPVLFNGKRLWEPDGFWRLDDPNTGVGERTRLWNNNTHSFFVAGLEGDPDEYLWRFKRDTTANTDIVEQVTDGSQPVRVGPDFDVLDTTLFFAGEDLLGMELWGLDLSSGNLQAALAKDVSAANSQPTHITKMSNQVLFAAYDGSGHGNLFSWDMSGPTLTKITSNNNPKRPHSLVVAAGTQLYFVHGKRVWTWGGSTPKELQGGYADPKRLTYVDNQTNPSWSRLFFVDDTGGSFPNAVGNLWLAPQPPSSGAWNGVNVAPANAKTIVAFDEKLYFVGTHNVLRVWEQPAQSPSTQPVIRGNKPDKIKSIVATTAKLYAITKVQKEHDLLHLGRRGLSRLARFENVIKDFFSVGPKLFFVDTSNRSTELWTSSGTKPRDTRPVIRNAGSNPRDYTRIPNRNLVVFSARGVQNGGRIGRELWVSDGTTAGTGLLKNINADPSNGHPFSSNPEQLTPTFDHVYFVADNGTNFHELWTTDGTAMGTVPAHGNTQETSVGIDSLTKLIDRVYFSAKDGRRVVLKSVQASGTAGSWTHTTREERYDGSELLDPADMTVIAGYLFFTAIRERDEKDRGRSVFVTNGTKILRVDVYCRVTGKASFTRLNYASNDWILFSGSRGARGQEPFRIDFQSLIGKF